MARNSSRAFRKRAQFVIARDGGMCWLCGHAGAITADHVIPYKHWPKDANGQPLPGLDMPENMKAAHGTRGTALANPCPTCGRLCNQSRGSGGGTANAAQPERHSRPW